MMIELKDVSKIYKVGDKKVYGAKNINLTVKAGDFAAVVGPSGCGKSTLLNLIGGIDNPSMGTILVDNDNLSHLKDRQLTNFRKDKVGFVFQFFNLVSTLTAGENVVLSLQLRGVGGVKAKTEAKQYLKMVGISHLANRFPSELSGGEQQRVGIARALAKKPMILLADEPTGNLDTKSSQKVISIMYQSAKKLGTTAILVTHNFEIARIADRIISLRDGEIIENKKNGQQSLSKND